MPTMRGQSTTVADAAVRGRLAPRRRPAAAARTVLGSGRAAGRDGRPRAGWEWVLTAGAVDQAPLGCSGPAEGATRAPVGGPHLQRTRWDDVPAVDVRHPHPRLLRQGDPRPQAGARAGCRGPGAAGGL